jgi:hypothetical protein
MRQPPRLSINDHTRQDFLICLAIWFALELVCFIFLPVFGAIERANEPWFSLSFAFGLGGSVLFALSSQILLTVSDRQQRYVRILQWLMGIIFAWMGLAGVAFPLLIIGIQAFARILSSLMS